MRILGKIGKVLKRFFENVSVFDEAREKMKKVRAGLSEGECYVEKIKIPTFDGSGSATHPHVLYFKDGWNGFKFWMVCTPYDNDRVELEVPSVLVSNDGVSFERVPGGSEVVAPVLKLSEPMEYYSDPFLVFREGFGPKKKGRLEVWYRYTREEEPVKNRIYRVATEDGVNYSEPEEVDLEEGFYMSLSILKDGDGYLMYYFDDGGMYVRASKDLKKWGKREKVMLDGFKGVAWHGEVREVEGEVILLLMSYDGELYFLKRTGKAEFLECRRLDFSYAPKGRFYSKVELYKSSIVKVQDIYYIYVPFKVYTMKGMRVWRRWEMTVTRIKKRGHSPHMW